MIKIFGFFVSVIVWATIDAMILNENEFCGYREMKMWKFAVIMSYVVFTGFTLYGLDEETYETMIVNQIKLYITALILYGVGALIKLKIEIMNDKKHKNKR